MGTSTTWNTNIWLTDTSQLLLKQQINHIIKEERRKMKERKCFIIFDRKTWQTKLD